MNFNSDLINTGEETGFVGNQYSRRELINPVRETGYLEQLGFKNKKAPGQDCPRTACKLKPM
jgi:hypothetical protein